MQDAPKTNGGRLLKRGDTFDPECGRTTHRLRVAQGILHNLGFGPTLPPHHTRCIKHPSNRFNRCFGFNYICDVPECPRKTNPAPTWPETCSGEVFDAAYRLACAVQDARGATAMRAINARQTAATDGGPVS